jgi:putative membrane protein
MHLLSWGIEFSLMIANLLIGGIALLHFYFFYLESIAWETAGKKAFKGALADDLFRPTRVLAANQGLYNSFLGAGLFWSLTIQDPLWHRNIALFFLICVLVAGLYGGYSASKKIYWIQAFPAALAILAVLAKM